MPKGTRQATHWIRPYDHSTKTASSRTSEVFLDRSVCHAWLERYYYNVVFRSATSVSYPFRHRDSPGRRRPNSAEVDWPLLCHMEQGSSQSGVYNAFGPNGNLLLCYLRGCSSSRREIY